MRGGISHIAKLVGTGHNPKCRKERVLACCSHSNGDFLGKENGKQMVSVKNSRKVPGMSREVVEPSGCIHPLWSAGVRNPLAAGVWAPRCPAPVPGG